ncbi:hypothetical protein PVIIG_05254 [Plasmodium vivax India VII]|uniref:Variable surface protein Vir14 n=1 Tax=Plasmodium vivax India VII TaxID=1077284 RepID=A0A0J9SJ04_PLAVI|nr:hypothetical protein PVIIG_05254 [Plasmodium vivax India VII]
MIKNLEEEHFDFSIIRWKFNLFDLSFKEELYSEIFNESLYKLTDLSDNIEYCRSLDELQLGKSIKIICPRLLKYLENKSFSRNNDNEYIYCLLLNYWVYNRLNIILQSNHPSIIYRAFGRIEYIWNNFIEDKLNNRKNITCKPIHSITTYDDWRYRKELYEYYLDYYPASLTVKNYPVRCDEFYKYVESKKTLYEHFKKRCPPNDTKRCPEFYAQCKQYDPDEVLSTLSCHEKMKQERTADSLDNSQRGGTYPSSETDSEVNDGRMRPDDAPKFSGNPKTVENVEIYEFSYKFFIIFSIFRNIYKIYKRLFFLLIIYTHG